MKRHHQSSTGSTSTTPGKNNNTSGYDDDLVDEGAGELVLPLEAHMEQLQTCLSNKITSLSQQQRGTAAGAATSEPLTSTAISTFCVGGENFSVGLQTLSKEPTSLLYRLACVRQLCIWLTTYWI